MLDSSVGSSRGCEMAMGEVRGQAATLQVEMVCLDELVAEDDRYRTLDRLVDWGFVRELAAPYYAEDLGRPSIDPIVLVKLMLAGALEGIASTRELLRQAGMRLDLRRFERGLPTTAPRPARARRAAGPGSAGRGASCADAGRAALGPVPKRKSSNRTSLSRTDPEAKLRGKPAQRPHLVYRGQVAVDRKQRVIVACRGEQADGFEGDAVEPLLDRARFACPELASIGADSGFAAARVWRAAERRRITAYIPPQPTMLPKVGEEPATEAQRQALAARSRCKSPAGIEAHRRRMADAEGVIGELKNQGTAARAQRRGTPHFHVQLLLNCTAVNCKRLADHAQQAQSGVAAAPETAESQRPAAAPAAATQPATAAADPSRWLAALLAAAPCTCHHLISLN